MPIVPYWVLDLEAGSQGVALQRVRAREVRRLRNLVRYRRQFARRAPVAAKGPRPVPSPRAHVPLRGAFNLGKIAAEIWAQLPPSGFGGRARRRRKNAIAAASRRANRR